jgi:hypothetical protein
LEVAPAARVNMQAMWALGIVENRIMRDSLRRCVISCCTLLCCSFICIVLYVVAVDACDM